MIKIMTIFENIKEEDFPKFLKRQGYKCVKITNLNAREIQETSKIKFKIGLGMPDFYVWNKQEKFLCEFKSCNDAWRIYQVLWVLGHLDIPFVLALVVNKKGLVFLGDLKREFNTLEEYSPIKRKKMFKNISLAHHEKNKVLYKYFEKNPLNFFPNNPEKNKSFELEIPEGIISILDSIDKRHFKDKQNIDRK